MSRRARRCQRAARRATGGSSSSSGCGAARSSRASARSRRASRSSSRGRACSARARSSRSSSCAHTARREGARGGAARALAHQRERRGAARDEREPTHVQAGAPTQPARACDAVGCALALADALPRARDRALVLGGRAAHVRLWRLCTGAPPPRTARPARRRGARARQARARAHAALLVGERDDAGAPPALVAARPPRVTRSPRAAPNPMQQQWPAPAAPMRARRAQPPARLQPRERARVGRLSTAPRGCRRGEPDPRDGRAARPRGRRRARGRGRLGGRLRLPAHDLQRGQSARAARRGRRGRARAARRGAPWRHDGRGSAMAELDRRRRRDAGGGRGVGAGGALSLFGGGAFASSRMQPTSRASSSRSSPERGLRPGPSATRRRATASSSPPGPVGRRRGPAGPVDAASAAAAPSAAAAAAPRTGACARARARAPTCRRGCARPAPRWLCGEEGAARRASSTPLLVRVLVSAPKAARDALRGSFLMTELPHHPQSAGRRTTFRAEALARRGASSLLGARAHDRAAARRRRQRSGEISVPLATISREHHNKPLRMIVVECQACA